MNQRPFPVLLRARHVRLSAVHVECLFGAGVALTALAALPVGGTFACAEDVSVAVDEAALGRVRVVGPCVPHTEVRVSPADLHTLGIDATRARRTPQGSVGCTLRGPRGTVVLASGLVTPRRTLHLSPDEARALDVVDGAILSLEFNDRPRLVSDVRVVVGLGRGLLLDRDDPAASDVSRTTSAQLTHAA